MALPSLKVKIGADTVDLNKALGGAEQDLSKFGGSVDGARGKLERFQEKASAMGRKMMPIAGVIGAIGLAAAGIVKKTADSAKEIDNLAKISGASTTEFQRNAAAAKSVNIEQGKLADIYKDMNDRVGDFMATGGGPMADFFENIAPKVGVTADEFARLSGPEALQLYATSLEKAGVSNKEMTFYMEAMAGDASALIPLLADGGAEMKRLGDAAEEAGGVMDEKAIAAAIRFNEQLDLLGTKAGSARDQLGNALMPVALALVDGLNQNVIPAIEGVVTGLTTLSDWFGRLPEPVQSAASIIGDVFGTNGPMFASVLNIIQMFQGLTAEDGPIMAMVATATALVAAWQRWSEEIKVVIGDGLEWIKTKFNELVEWLTALPEQMFEIGANIIQGLRDGITGAWETAKEGVGNAFTGVVDLAKGIFQTQSPSRVFHEIGENVGQGLANGIQSTFGIVQSAVSGLAKITTNDAWGMAKNVVSAMGSMFEGSKPIAVAQALINTFQGITEALKMPPPMSYAQAAATAAAGFAQVRSIMSTSKSGGGGAGASAGAAVQAPAQQQAPVNEQYVNVNMTGEGPIGRGSVRGLIEMLNEAIDDGAVIKGVTVSG